MPIKIDHYTNQFLTGHGDRNAKLQSFRLVRDAKRGCGLTDETVDHVLFYCKLHDSNREKLKKSLNLWNEGLLLVNKSLGSFLNVRAGHFLFN